MKKFIYSTIVSIIFIIAILISNPVQADLVVSSEYFSSPISIVDFSQFSGLSVTDPWGNLSGFIYGSGPVQVGGIVGDDITWSSNWRLSVIGNDGYGVPNPTLGRWDSDRDGYVGLNGSYSLNGIYSDFTMRFDFNDDPVSAVGGFMNYIPYSTRTTVISVLAVDGTVLESYDLESLAPIHLSNAGDNLGAFRGIIRPAADIAAFTLTNGSVVLDNLTFTRGDNPPLPEGSITVISPNGGEELSAGSTYEIIWTSEGISDYVRIEYSANSGTEWIEIATVTENDGFYVWELECDLSGPFLLRIADVNGEPYDVSDAVFDIALVNPCPNIGTVGSELTITGSAFGDNKGKVYVGEYGCKVKYWSDESIRCQVIWWWNVTVPQGDYSVRVEPVGADPITVGEYTIIPPIIDSIEPTPGSDGDEITIYGRFFGNWWGKVYLGNINHSLERLGWHMDPLTGDSLVPVVVPMHKFPPGVYDVTVENTVGSYTLPDAFTVE